MTSGEYGVAFARARSEGQIEQRVTKPRGCSISRISRQKAGRVGRLRQRVAIAERSQSPLFLLDEPLSNLDAALRMRTRVELAQLRQKVDAAVIMVTHDQVEAMTLADRIIVMNDRRIQQVGSPMEIYLRPDNEFVGRFVGSPAMTLAPAELVESDGQHATVRLGDGSELATRVPRSGLPKGGTLRVGLRPEMVRVAAGPGNSTTATIELVERLGERTLVYARLADGLAITAEDAGDSRVQVGDTVGLDINGAAAHLFDAEGRGHHAEALSK